MKLAILSRKSSLYSTHRLKEAAEKCGHDAPVIDYLRCYMTIASHKPQVLYQGHALEGFDAVIPRIGASHTFYGTAVVRQFEMGYVFTANESQAISRSRDKLRCLQLLARKGVGLPATSIAHSTKDIDGLMEIAGKPPFIVKLLEGTQGKGVVLAETAKAAESLFGAFRQLDAYFLVQEFVKPPKGTGKIATDIRAFVVGDKVVAAMERRAKPGEFRSNLHRGGTARAITLTAEEEKTALAASKLMGDLHIAGVDMMRSENGPVVLEINSSPGLEGIEKSTGIDVAGKIIEFIENHPEVKKGGKRR